MALTDQQSGKGTTHVLVRRTRKTEVILGYITLRATSYTQTVNGKIHGSPALEIFELAVKDKVAGHHIGTELVKFALATAFELNRTTLGIQYVTLCADQKAVPFYEKFHFGRLDEQGEIPREQWNENCVPMFLKLLV